MDTLRIGFTVLVPGRPGILIGNRAPATACLASLALASIMAGCRPGEAQPGAAPSPIASQPHPSGASLPPTPSRVPPTPPRQPTATAPEPYTIVSEPAPLIGTWRFSDSDFTRFYPDGTIHEAANLVSLDGEPFAVNWYSFDEGRLILRELSVSGVPPCGNDPARYEALLLEGGRLQLVDIRDACGPRAGNVRGDL